MSLRKSLQIIISFILLLPFWFLMSGKFDFFHIILGLLSVFIVSLWSGKILIQSPETSLLSRFNEFIRFIKYAIWLMIEIVKSNIHVIKVSLSRNLKENINPQIVIFKTSLKKDFSKFILANSITLTPGTVTIRIKDDEFIIHALTNHTAAGIPGNMEAKIAHVFGEDISP
ncbi:cation transporter [Candidatus Marinamargulisbacteria bacterium SCGC AG-333-B06]|nr:cation transporter [Candidatus Marinamargulisbacteria bacterium SCGC AG-333-B06]